VRSRFRSYLSSIGLAFLLTGPSVHAAGEPTVLRIGHTGHGQGALHGGAVRFAQQLETISSGAMQVDIVGRGALGGISDMFVQMQAGALDIQVIDVPAIGVLKAGQRMDVLLTPFLFESQAHLRRYFASETAHGPLRELAANTGIRYIGYVAERSPRVISTTRKAVRAVDDMAGLKMRIPGSPLFREVFAAWGSVPTPTSPGDMFMALRTGMVDGEDNGIVNMVNGQNATVIRHVTPIDWHRAVVGLWFSDIRWNTLDERERDWVHAAASASEQQAADAFELDMKAARKRLEALGIQVHEADLSGFAAIVDDFVARHEGERWPDGEVARIRSLR